MLQNRCIHSVDDADWPLIWSIYEASFPKNERRTLDAQKTIMPHPRYRFEAWSDHAGLVGFTAWWSYERFSFLEHFAVDARRRSGGVGRKILAAWMERPHPVVLLEIDPVTDDISRRRWNFYERLGFLENDIAHSHPSYFDGTGSVPLLVLSYPHRIDKNIYTEFAHAEINDMLGYLAR